MKRFCAKSTVTITTIQLLAFILMLLGVASCQAQLDQRTQTVAQTNDDFKNVTLNSQEQAVCSPDISGRSDFVGIEISAPTEVEYEFGSKAEDGSFAAIPICGVYTLDMAVLLKNATIYLVAQNTETEQMFHGVVIEKEPDTELPDPDEEELTAEDVEGQLLTAYLNPNLLRYVNLPKEEATYLVMMQIGETKSNVVTVKLVEKK